MILEFYLAMFVICGPSASNLGGGGLTGADYFGTAYFGADYFGTDFY